TSLDTDGDGIPDYLDLDSDNDGILDSDELTIGQLSYEFYDSVPAGNSVDNIPTTTPDYSGNVSDFDVTSLSTSLTGNADTFSIRYKGSINIATAGAYTFYTNSDDGSKLFIDGIEVVDNDGLTAPRERSENITLSAGVHSIEILFFENDGGQILEVSYESSLITKRSIPFSILSSDLDSDNDGVPNRLDLDSDNDGCSDANEYYFSGNADGNIDGDDDLEYGTSSTLTVDADGRVEQADYNGTTYADAIDNTITEACNACNPISSGNTDTDGDGIADLCDLDADNDGILNADEANGSGSAVFDASPEPEAFWTFDNTTNDSSVNNHDAVAGGTIAPGYSTTDVIEGTHSASFNGTDQEIRYSVDGGFMESAYTQISFSAWIKPDNVSGNRIIYEEGGNSNGSALWLNDGLLTYTTRAASSSFNQIDVTVGDALTVDNKWHHVAATFDSGTLTVYLDGVSNSVTADYNTVPAHGDAGGIGGTIGVGSSAVDDGVAVSNYSGLMDAARYDNTVAWSLSRIRYEATLFLDTDGDGIPNHLDLDSDNDGIYDVLEAEPGFAGTITAEGRIDINTNEITANGVPTAANTGNGFTPVDTGNDGTPNFINLDSDADGCSDANEYYFSGNADGNLNGDDDLEYGTSSTLTVDADGRVEQALYNGTNYADAIDNTITEACNACNPVASGNTDTDGDGVADLCDLDSDNDGILDTEEGACPTGSANKPITDLALAHNFPSGRYYFDLGNGLFEANIDASEGGGWVLILQYVHEGGTNPDLNSIAENADLPIGSSAALGTDESSDLTKWGHAGNARTANLTGADELRFYGETSGHSRIIHFKTDQGLSYFTSGTGNIYTTIAANFTALTGHTANIPLATNNGDINRGGLALTEFPFYTTGNYHWGIKGRGNRWEVDDFPGNESRSTIHRVWIRNSAPQTCIATDTDLDGTPDYLDLDSDNDGCSDANEYYNNVGADGGDGGVYGVGTPTVDADGLVFGAEYNGSGYSAVIDDSTFVCKDTDGDGLADSLDLDSDNDGILNEDECGIPKQKTVLAYTGVDQTYNVPAGASHLKVKIWGAGGRGDTQGGRGVGGAGGFTEVMISVSSLTSTSLTVTVGQGGDSSTGSRTYGNGGAGDSDGSRNFGSGGGMSALTYASLSNPASVSISDLIAIAGGGGTSPAFTNPGSHAGEGGGLSGGDADSGSASINGLGGDQNSGGGSPPNGNPGDYLVGGNAVLNGGAGGGGYYGGGSGTIASNNEGSGGGGSGYISITSTIDGQTIRGTIQTPPRTTDPDYVAGVGTGGDSGAGNGGNGLVVIEALFLDCDTDGDGILNYLDTDSDNDGIYDVLEADPTFTGTISAEGRISGTTTNGVPDAANAGNGFTPVDTDADLTLNFMDLNSDGDACPDANEYYNNPSADGGDNGIYGTGVPTLASATVTPAGLVVEAGYNGTGLANVTNASISSGCEPYIFEGSAGDVGLGGTWETQANWNFNRLPTALDTAIVKANANVTLSQEVGELSVDAPYTVFIDTLQTLHIKENLTNKGDFRGEGFVVFDGTAAQQIIGNGSATDPDAGSFEHIRVNNSATAPAGVTLTDNADLIHILDLNLGTFTIAPGKLLTFKSTEVQTAVLPEVGKGGSAGISGCVVVERYIQQNKRAFRYIASAVNTNTTCGKASINANLQEGNQVTDYTNYPGTSETPGYGTHITGAVIGTTANGFDATQTGNPSMFTWNEASSPQRWDEIPNTTDVGDNTLDIGDSYALMIRGGRELNLNVNNNVASQDPTTLRFTGELRTGNVPVNNLASGNGKFSLVANPYQSQVDIEQLLSDADLLDVKQEVVYIYDPNIGLRGGYAVLDLAGPDYDPVPNGSKATKFLQPNQSMFVENTGPSPRLIFKEIYKKNSNHGFTNGTFSVDNTASLNITLKRNDNSDVIVVDGVRLYFKESFDNAIQNNDALKFWNSDESFAIRHKDKYLSIERRKYPAPEETVQFNLFNYKNAAYQLEMDMQDFEKTAYLKDNYTGDLQKLENNAVTTYSFTANKQIPESVSITRFELKFEQETLGVEEINTKDISVYPNPASEILNIQLPDFSGQNAKLQLMDMAGRLIFTESVNVENGRISTRKIENLGSGVYLINIEVDDKKYTKKIIIK
ncbi:T9SS type A sorting domain-containing protein, partial [Psychroflexus sp. CAK57W]|uniref:T9SS type A sorting domain-containing protein n=1 Tax=Psychroflexus curvus TaxID=2873595 RepID=UPI001CC9207F